MKTKSLHTDQRIIRGTVAGILFMVLILSFLFDPSTYQLIECAFHNFTGLPCPGCGLTRSFHAMAHLDLAEALGLNLMGPLLFLGALAFAILFFTEAVSGRGLQYRPKIFTPKILFLALMGLWLVAWLVRLLAGL